MDIQAFTNERLKFAHFFYSEGVKPFKAIIALIENEQEPYVPVYDESDEPQFIYEWIQAKDGIEAVGLSSISMLSSALQLYMNGWLDRVEARRVFQKITRKGSNGWFHALKDAMVLHGVDFSRCPVDVDVLEQMVLVRNRTQHSDDITSNSIRHLNKDLNKFQSHVFVNPSDSAMVNSRFSWIRVYVDDDIFSNVADELKIFCDWLEKQYCCIAN